VENPVTGISRSISKAYQVPSQEVRKIKTLMSELTKRLDTEMGEAALFLAADHRREKRAGYSIWMKH
jgi:hypothetical protein